jgi:hypothetical protein
LLAEWNAADHPAVGLDEVDGDGGNPPFLLQDAAGQLEQQLGNFPDQLGDLRALTLTFRMGMAFFLY